MEAPANKNEKFDLDEFRKNVISATGDNAIAIASFMRIADVVVDKNTPTAHIKLDGIPEIHINPDFVQEYATTPEHQFILIYHELMHMILRHGTRIRCKNDNIIADAIINAMICTQYPQARYTRFFTNFYDAREFPQNLLRPYSGFKRSSIKRKYRKLYSYSGISWFDLKRLFESMEKDRKDKGQEDWKFPILLGDHSNSDAPNSHSDEILEPIADKMEQSIRNAIEDEIAKEQSKLRSKFYRRSNCDYDKLEKELSKIKTQGYGRSVFLRSISVLKKKIEKRREIEKALMEHAKQSNSSRIETVLKGMFPRIPLMTPIPNYRDRYGIVADAAGVYRPFYKNPLLPKDYGVCSIYLDVSGSMGNYVKLVYRVANDCKDYLDDKIYLFSNVISAITKDELLKGVVKSTGGTDFDIIINHMEKNKIKKSIIFTDGGAKINNQSLQKISKNGMKIVAVIPPNSMIHYVKKFCHSVIKIDGEGKVI